MHRTKVVRAFAWLGLMTLTAPLALGAPEQATPLPVGMPVSLDGTPEPGEWQDAAPFLLGPAGPELRMKQVRSTLLLSLVTGRPWPRAAHLVMFFRPGEGQGAFSDDGSVRIDYEPFDHNRPHALVQVKTKDGWVRRDGEVVFRAAGLFKAATVEGAVSLDLLGIRTKPPPPLAWVVAWMTPGASPSALTWPSGLDLGASNAGPPKDLASTVGWARTSQFPGAGGPGAFPTREWEAMVARDRELTAKGEAAHVMALSLLGDVGAGDAGERPKKDAPIRDTILAGLSWVASVEPLTGADVRAQAVGLWNLNRCPEALASLSTLADQGVGTEAFDRSDTLRMAAQVAADAERFEESAARWDALADALPESMRTPYLAAAKTARERAKAFEAELAARREDAAKGDQPLAILKTSKGEIVLRLLEDDVPEPVKQFVYLAETAKSETGKPFFEGTSFHRVVAAGVAQGGDPRSATEGCEAAGAGGCPWWIAPERNARHGFFRGAVGFALTPDKKVRSQFFLMTAPKLFLSEHGFPCFATVVSGMDVVDRLEVCDKLESVTILRKRDHPYEPKKSY